MYINAAKVFLDVLSPEALASRRIQVECTVSLRIQEGARVVENG